MKLRKDVRQNKIKFRKNFLPTLIIISVLWILTLLVVYFVDPAGMGSLQLFLLLVFLASLFTFSTLLANTRRGLIISIALTIFLTLKYLGSGNLLHVFLLIIVCVCVDIFFSK